MANEIRATYDTGEDLYALIYNAAGLVWQTTTTTFVAQVNADQANYDITLTEQGADSGEYRGDWPVDADMVEGIYSVECWVAAALPVVRNNDERVGETGEMVWDGGSTELDALETIDLITETIMGPAGDDLDTISGQIDTVDANVDAILVDTGTTIPAYILSDVIGADGDTLETLSDQMDILGAGSGGTEETYTVRDSVTGLPLDGVHVWVTTDRLGANIIMAGFTNAAGVVKFWHDLAAGTTIYLWRELAGHRFPDNPNVEVTS